MGFDGGVERKAKLFGMTVAELFRCGIFFWVGAGVYSLINLLLNLRHASNIALYDGLISGVAVVGLVLNVVLLRRKRKADDGRT